MTQKDLSNVALFDLDGTLADHDEALRRDMNILQSPDEPAIEHFWDVKEPHLRARIDMVRRQPGWWRNLKELHVGFTLLKMAYEIGFRIHILTKGPSSKPEAWMEKVQWCHSHISNALGSDAEYDITITEDKSLVYGKVLVDDYPGYMDPWLKHRPRGLGLMPYQSYNHCYSHPNVFHVGSGFDLEHARSLLLHAYHRKPKEA